MTKEEKLTIVDRASKLFQEWLAYLVEGGTKFNLAPREDIDEAFKEWNEKFMVGLEEELENLWVLIIPSPSFLREDGSKRLRIRKEIVESATSMRRMLIGARTFLEKWQIIAFGTVKSIN